MKDLGLAETRILSRLVRAFGYSGSFVGVLALAGCEATMNQEGVFDEYTAASTRPALICSPAVPLALSTGNTCTLRTVSSALATYAADASSTCPSVVINPINGSVTYSTLSKGTVCVLAVKISYDNGGSEIVSTSITPANNPPSPPAAVNCPSSPHALSPGNSCTITAATPKDRDTGDLITYYNNGSTCLDISVNKDTGAATFTAPAENLTCEIRIRAYDNTTYSDTTGSGTITGTDHAPVAAAITPSAFNEDTQSQAITLSYTDADGDLASGCAVSNAQHVSVTQSCACTGGLCTVKVTGAGNYNGAASFDYTVTANGKTSNSATASLTITAVDDAPVAAAISPAAFNEDVQSQAITLSYSDAEGNAAASCAISNAQHVSVTQSCACTSGICTVKVTGAGNYNGVASFDYTVTANGNTSNTATASLTITAVDDAPVAAAISPAAFNEDVQSQAITLSYSDAEGNAAASCAISNTQHVSVTQACACTSGICTVKVTGDTNYNGTASFDYTVTANGRASNTATASLSITSVNDAPTISVSSTTPATNMDTPVSVDVTINDVDSPLRCDQSLSATSYNTSLVPDASVAWSGTAPDCVATITPVTGQHGSAGIKFYVTDNGSSTAVSTIGLTVNAPGGNTLNENWPFSFGTATSYTLSTSTLEFTYTHSAGGDGLVRLKPSDQTDVSFVPDASNGSASSGSAWDGARGMLRLGQAGGCDGTTTNCAELDASWAPAWADIIGVWHFNESFWTGTSNDVLDASENRNNGRLYGTTAYPSAGGKLQKAGYFGTPDANARYIDVGLLGNAGSQMADGFTISVWLKTFDTGHIAIFGSSEPDVNLLHTIGLELNQDPGLGNTQGGIRFAMGPNFGSWNTTSVVCGSNENLGYLDGNWHHLAVSVNAHTSAGSTGSCQIFLDGVSRAVAYSTNSTSFNSFTNFQAPIFLGAWNEGSPPAGQYKGYLDEVAFWHKALTAAEIQLIYQRQAPTYAGSYTSRIMNAYDTVQNWTKLIWKPTLPFFKELPDNGNSESASDYASLDNSSLMNGIAGLWHLDESAWTGATDEVKDDSGQGKHLTASGSIQNTNAGLFRNAAYFNAASVHIGRMEATISSNDNWTISAWIKPTSKTETAKHVVYNGVPGGSGFGIGWVNGSWTITYGGTAYSQVGMEGTANKWQHVVITRTGGNAAFYLNGKMVNAAVTAVSPSTPVGGTVIGYAGAFHGMIDEVAFWSRSLNAAEITQLHRRGANRLKFQVRSCAWLNCFDQDSLTDGGWKGPDNTNATYFSEIHSNAIPGDGTGLVLSTPPNVAFSSFFPVLGVADNPYFQYRVILESDDTLYSCDYGGGANSARCSPELKSVSVEPIHYDNSIPTVITNTGYLFSDLTGLTETLGSESCSGGVRYNVAVDPSGPWLYYNTGTPSWASSDGSYTQANSRTELNAALGTFDTVVLSGSSIYLKVFLKSDGTHACELDNVNITGTP